MKAFFVKKKKRNRNKETKRALWAQKIFLKTPFITKRTKKLMKDTLNWN
jgi:hypothetical protein